MFFGMERTAPEITLLVLKAITDLLTDLSDDGSDDFDRAEREDYFGRVAELIVDELGLEVSGIDEGGRVVATMSALNI